MKKGDGGDVESSESGFIIAKVCPIMVPGMFQNVFSAWNVCYNRYNHTLFHHQMSVKCELFFCVCSGCVQAPLFMAISTKSSNLQQHASRQREWGTSNW